MDSESPPDSTGAGNGGNRSQPDTSTAEAALKAKLSKKRTKTGCLTCRKRRIKCGEERPICKNCVKSKRHCEGYSQRVMLRPTAFDYQSLPRGGAHITFHAGPAAGAATPYLYTGHPAAHQQQLQYADENAYIHRQPLRPPPSFHAHPEVQPPLNPGLMPLLPAAPVQPQHFHHPQPTVPPGQLPYSFTMAENLAQPPFHSHVPGNDAASSNPPQQPFGVVYPPHASSIVPAMVQMIPGSYLNEATPPTSQYRYGQHPGHVQSWQTPDPEPAFPPHAMSSQPVDLQQFPTPHLPYEQTAHHHRITLPSGATTTPSTTPGPRRTFSNANEASTNSSPMGPTLNQTTPEFYEHEYHPLTSITTNYLLSTAAVEIHDDDYYDVMSDDDDFETESFVDAEYNSAKHQRTLSRVLARNQISVGDQEIRRYDTFLYDGILERYNVEQVANPLNNPATARVFAHFISATGPSLSIFERHPRNTSVIFRQGVVPLSQQGLWTYSMPMAALRNQGLLHAILALASLHIARIQGASVTPSIQHYAWALKRIHHCVGHPKKRLKLTTIAASMLLGFYEIMTADHMKWNLHLAGSKQLFVEIDFIKLNQKFRRMKLEHTWRIRNGYLPQSPAEDAQASLLDQIHDADENLISQLVGKEVHYDDPHGYIDDPRIPLPPDIDISRFEMLKDLYWWYCKQDAYQSIISGNPLLMAFDRWPNCPPRAPLGRPDAVYGSFDHLVLLLGRIADFSARDRTRKLRQIDANGGQWRPAPGMNIPQPPQPPTPVSSTSQGPPPSVTPQMPQFYGMAPPPRANVQMPSSYTPITPDSAPQSRQSPTYDPDLQTATRAALKEYDHIRAALRVFKDGHGEAFDPLPPEYHVPMPTAFGPGLMYRSYDIACLWALYNMAMIIIIRSHPHMPPAMHMAAGVAARETAPYANEIGRIVAGISPDGDATPTNPNASPNSSLPPLNPTLGSAATESCMPSFFAAVQYQDAAQRQQTVERIFRIARRTGWGSADLIANGCETAWVKAAAAGRGPPYTRTVRSLSSDDPRLNGSWERLDPDAAPDERDEGDRRLVMVKPNARLAWAIGVMGVEEDVQRMKL